MSKQLDRDDIHSFLLPYRSRVFNPLELLGEMRGRFDGWREDGSYQYRLTFRMSDQFEDERKVYGINDDMMAILGAWRSPMAGRNLWVYPGNPDARMYSDIYVTCDECNAEFGGTRHANRHEDDCKHADGLGAHEELEQKLNAQRIDWLETAATYGLDISTASRRLGWSPQTARDFIWETNALSYETIKRDGKHKMASTWHVAREWGTDVDVIANAAGVSESTVRAYISRFSTLDDDIPEDPTRPRR